MKVMDVISTTPDKDQTTQQHFTKVFRQIGAYFSNNAERLGSSIADTTSNVDVFINLEPNSLVEIDISQKELLVQQSVLMKEMTVDINGIVEKLAEKIDKKLSEVLENE